MLARFGLALLLATAGCGRARTEILVGVLTDLPATPGIADRLDRVRLTVNRGGFPLVMTDWTISGLPGQDDELPGSFGIYTDDGSEPALFVQLTAFFAGTGTSLARDATLAPISGETRFLRLALLKKCVKVACAIGTTCVEGSCRSPVIDPHTLPIYQTGMELTIACDSTAIHTGTGKPVAKSGAGQCTADEECIEGTCRKRPASDGGAPRG
ncbi:MAG: hypothetical protein EXR72_08910 [Myxococcales bacterium]|nr:hypothetical protein [Myxococcales bacterium]